MDTIARHEWFGCYANSWQGDLVPEAFSHPAKFSRGLIARIYTHLLTQGYIKPGSVVVDPFGGIAAGALDAMINGLHWRGVELEEKFVGLAQENIALWDGRYAAHFPQWGTAEIYTGDSRRLCEVLSGAGCVVGSPPFVTTGADDSRQYGGLAETGARVERGVINKTYGRSPGQLGSMKEGQPPDAIIGSPPFSGDKNLMPMNGQGVRSDMKAAGKMPESQTQQSPGNLALLRATDEGLTAIISSPPYADAVSGIGEGPGARHDHKFHSGDNATKKSSEAGYGETAGQMGGMAVVGSPPFMGQTPGNAKLSFETRPDGASFGAGRSMQSQYTDDLKPDYSDVSTRTRNERGQWLRIEDSPAYDNLSNSTGDNFWSAARVIVEQCYQLLPPGGVAVFVTGDFVRNKERVYFGRQWLALCEAVGFKPLEHIVAWKREPGPVQVGIFEDRDHTIDRVSFFRRLANRDNPDNAILNEDVWIVQKI